MFFSKWGTVGSDDGQCNWPRGVAVASGCSVYVTEMEGNRIQKFTSDGAYIGKWGMESEGDGQFDSVVSIAIAPDGSVYVADTYNHRIQKFSAGQ